MASYIKLLKTNNNFVHASVYLFNTDKVRYFLMIQNVGLPALSSTQIRKQEVHTNGPVLDETILSDPEVIS